MRRTGTSEAVTTSWDFEAFFGSKSTPRFVTRDISIIYKSPRGTVPTSGDMGQLP